MPSLDGFRSVWRKGLALARPGTRAAVLLAVVIVSGCGREGAVWDADDALGTGWTLYRLGEFAPAVRAFEQATEQAGTNALAAAEALFGQASVWNLRTPLRDQDKPKALTLYQAAIAQAPEGPLTPWSRLALARMQHLVPVGREPDDAAVRAAYAEVVAAHPDHLAGREAFLHLQALDIKTFEPAAARRAVTALETFVSQNDDHRFISGAHALLGVAYEILDEPERQLTAEIRALELLERDPTNPKLELAGRYWRIATIAEFRVGDFETARRFYRLLLEEYPLDIRRHIAETALARMDAFESRLIAEGGA